MYSYESRDSHPKEPCQRLRIPLLQLLKLLPGDASN